MTSKQDELEEYKKAIRIKFEIEKTKEYSSFLIVPSRAKLRKLCVERLKDSTNLDDLKSFSLFFGFDFSISNQIKLKLNTDKFRPIETFFKGETDLMDIEGINVAAFLVDFKPRPFRKFTKGNYEKEDGVIGNEDKSQKSTVLNSLKKDVPRKNTIKKKLGIGVLGLIGIFSLGYTVNDTFISNKDCMVWQNDHYVDVDCDSDVDSFSHSTVVKPYDKNEFNLKRILPNKNTVFMVDGKVKVYYCKINKDSLDYFDCHGTHPINGKQLHAITPYIIEKYINRK